MENKRQNDKAVGKGMGNNEEEKKTQGNQRTKDWTTQE